jgi:hypothetical protein
MTAAPAAGPDAVVGTPVRMAVGLAVLFSSALAALTWSLVVVAVGGNDHQVADWLIDYAGGYNRRGLLGELLARAIPPSATLWTLLAFQLLCYAPVYGVTVAYLRRTNWSWSAIALACGPAAMPFIGWDPAGGFRKEVIGFACLSLLAMASRRRGAPAVGLVGIALSAWMLGAFSWEALGALLPAVWFLIRGLPFGRRTRSGLAAAFTVVAGTAAGAALLVPGDAATAQTVCLSFVERGLNAERLCGGAVRWLGYSLGDSLQAVVDSYPGYLAYLPLAVIATLPVLTSPWLRRYWRWALASVLAVAPLFVIGIDYGRWLHVLVVSLAICMMTGERELTESPQWTPLATLIYCTTLGVPHAHVLNTTIGVPLLGMLGQVVQLCLDLTVGGR